MNKNDVKTDFKLLTDLGVERQLAKKCVAERYNIRFDTPGDIIHDSFRDDVSPIVEDGLV